MLTMYNIIWPFLTRRLNTSPCFLNMLPCKSWMLCTPDSLVRCIYRPGKAVRDTTVIFIPRVCHIRCIRVIRWLLSPFWTSKILSLSRVGNFDNFFLDLTLNLFKANVSLDIFLWDMDSKRYLLSSVPYRCSGLSSTTTNWETNEFGWEALSIRSFLTFVVVIRSDTALSFIEKYAP